MSNKISPTDEEVDIRIEALQQALKFHTPVAGIPNSVPSRSETVLKTAGQFEKFILEGTVPDAPSR